jgi:hypothetical protein
MTVDIAAARLRLWRANVRHIDTNIAPPLHKAAAQNLKSAGPEPDSAYQAA